MSKATCSYCGANAPYTDWTKCEACSSVLAIAGKESTKEQKLARAQFERRAAKHSTSRSLVAGHVRAAVAYERSAEEA